MQVQCRNDGREFRHDFAASAPTSENDTIHEGPLELLQHMSVAAIANAAHDLDRVVYLQEIEKTWGAHVPDVTARGASCLPCLNGRVAGTDEAWCIQSQNG